MTQKGEGAERCQEQRDSQPPEPQHLGPGPRVLAGRHREGTGYRGLGARGQPGSSQSDGAKSPADQEEQDPQKDPHGGQYESALQRNAASTIVPSSRR